MLVQDGIHWNAEAHRRVTNILLTHVCAAWDIILPPPSLEMSSSSTRSGNREPRKRGHQRCNSLPDMVVNTCNSRAAGMGVHFDHNNNWVTHNTGISGSNTTRNRPLGDGTMAKLSQGMKAYTTEHGLQHSSQNEFWQQRAFVGAIRQQNGSYGVDRPMRDRMYTGFS